MNTIFILTQIGIVWAFGGAILYDYKKSPDYNFKQKMFLRVICGPMVWAFLLLRLVGTIGDKVLNSILSLLK